MRDLSHLQRMKPLRKQAGFLQFLPLIGAGLGLLGAKKAPKEQTTTQGGQSLSSQTSSTALPQQITGPAGIALNRAGQLFGSRAVAPLSPEIGNAVNRLMNPGANYAPTSSIFASGASINPHLDTVFNTAADATQNRLATEFAHAGRVNSGSHQQARSQDLQTLAAQVYAPGFEAERARQYGASEAGVDRGLNQQEANLQRNLSTVPGLFGAGQYIQQYNQGVLDSPTNALNQYIGQLGGLSPFFPGSTTQVQSTNQTGNVTQPLYNNPLTGALGGAMLGGYLQGAIPQQQLQPQQAMPYYNPYGSPWSMGGIGWA